MSLRFNPMVRWLLKWRPFTVCKRHIVDEEFIYSRERALHGGVYGVLEHPRSSFIAYSNTANSGHETIAEELIRMKELLIEEAAKCGWEFAELQTNER